MIHGSPSDQEIIVSIISLSVDHNRLIGVLQMIMFIKWLSVNLGQSALGSAIPNDINVCNKVSGVLQINSSLSWSTLLTIKGVVWSWSLWLMAAFEIECQLCQSKSIRSTGILQTKIWLCRSTDCWSCQLITIDAIDSPSDQELTVLINSLLLRHVSWSGSLQSTDVLEIKRWLLIE